MRTDDKIREEKLRYDINREAERKAALSSGKIDNYEYLRCEEILPSDQSRAIEQAKFICSSFGRALEKQKNNDQERKHVQVLKILKLDTQQLSIKDEIPEDQLSEEAKN